MAIDDTQDRETPDQTNAADSDAKSVERPRRRSTGMHPFDMSEESLKHISELNVVASSESDVAVTPLLDQKILEDYNDAVEGEANAEVNGDTDHGSGDEAFQDSAYNSTDYGDGGDYDADYGDGEYDSDYDGEYGSDYGDEEYIDDPDLIDDSELEDDFDDGYGSDYDPSTDADPNQEPAAKYPDDVGALIEHAVAQGSESGAEAENIDSSSESPNQTAGNLPFPHPNASPDLVSQAPGPDSQNTETAETANTDPANEDTAILNASDVAAATPAPEFVADSDGFDSYDVGAGFQGQNDTAFGAAEDPENKSGEPSQAEIDDFGSGMSYDLPDALKIDASVPDPDDAVYSAPEKVIPTAPENVPSLDTVFSAESAASSGPGASNDSDFNASQGVTQNPRQQSQQQQGQFPVPRGLSGEIPTDLIEDNDSVAPPAFPDDPGFQKSGAGEFGSQAVTQLSGEVPTGAIAEVFGMTKSGDAGNENTVNPAVVDDTSETAMVPAITPEQLNQELARIDQDHSDQIQSEPLTGDEKQSNSLLGSNRSKAPEEVSEASEPAADNTKSSKKDSNHGGEFSLDRRKRSGFLRRPTVSERDTPPLPIASKEVDDEIKARADRSPSRRVGFLSRDRDENKPRHKPTRQFSTPSKKKPTPEEDSSAPGRIRQDALEEIFKRWNDLKKKNAN